MRHPWFLFIVLAVFLVDAIWLYVVWVRIRPRLMKLGRTMAERKATLAAADTILSECLRESYSGDPDTLSSVLAGVAPRLHEMLSGRGLEPDPEVVRDLVARSLAKHGVAGATAREAVRRLAA